MILNAVDRGYAHTVYIGMYFRTPLHGLQMIPKQMFNCSFVVNQIHANNFFFFTLTVFAFKILYK